MRRVRTRGAVAALALGLFAVILLAGPAQALAPAPAPASGLDVLPGVAAGRDDFTFDAFDADYTLTRADDGTSRLRVVETIVAVFPETDQNRGIRRAIPDTYNGQPVNARLVSVTDENGVPRAAEVDDVDGVFSVESRADGFVHGRQSYVITYTLENVTWDFPDSGLEFYWDVNGVQWAQPFGTVTGRLHLAGDLAAQLTGAMACYQGYQGAKDACASIERTEDAGETVITARAVGLGPSQNLTLAVGFVPGTFAVFDGAYLRSPFGWLQGIAGVGLLGTAALAVRSRRRWLRDEPGRPTIIAEYAPPAQLDALESAVFMQRQPKAVPAEVLEQALVGSIRIIEGEQSRWRKAPLIAELVDASRADGAGRMLLEGLFPDGRPGAQFEFGSPGTRLATVTQKILAAADEELTRRGMRRAVPARARVVPLVLGAVALVLVGVLGVIAIGRSVHALVPVIVIVLGVIVFGVVIGLVARRPLTARGAETRDHLRGLEQFISWAEADRIRMLQSPTGAQRVPVDVSDPRQKLALYEKLLPYAVVFGQEKQWSKELAVLYTAAGASGPYWFAGSGSFDASAFASSVGSLSAAASSSSSMSGGAGGGGSSGGGGGGGGGGGV